MSWVCPYIHTSQYFLNQIFDARNKHNLFLPSQPVGETEAEELYADKWLELLDGAGTKLVPESVSSIPLFCIFRLW